MTTVERIERLEERKKVKEGAVGARRNKGGVVGNVDEMCYGRKKEKGKEGERTGKNGARNERGGDCA